MLRAGVAPPFPLSGLSRARLLRPRELRPRPVNPLVEKLFAIMKERGITQEVLADIAGVSQSTISSWQRRQSPNMGHFRAVANALEYDLELVEKKK